MKYIYYDEPQPLERPALTTEQKMSIFYDPEKAAEPPTEKGYRIYPLSYVRQSQTKAQTVLRCYIGQMTPVDVFTVQVGITFDILSSMVYENNTRSWALSRCLAIEQTLWEALNGVNMAGIGTIYSDRRQLPETGSYNISDDNSNVGRRVHFGLTWKDSNMPPHQSCCGLF